MALLTDIQLTRLRSLTGDTNSNLYDLTDDEMDDEYANAEQDFDVAVVYVLRRRLGMAAKWTDHSGEARSESRSQRFDHLKTLLELWEEKTGLSGGGIFAGTIDLGLDEDEALL